MCVWPQRTLSAACQCVSIDFFRPLSSTGDGRNRDSNVEGVASPAAKSVDVHACDVLASHRHSRESRNHCQPSRVQVRIRVAGCGEQFSELDGQVDLVREIRVFSVI
jgi:hypothetical protein